MPGASPAACAVMSGLYRCVVGGRIRRSEGPITLASMWRLQRIDSKQVFILHGMTPLDRRTFLVTGAALAAASCTPLGANALQQSSSQEGAIEGKKPAAASNSGRRPCVISSANGLPAVNEAMARLRAGAPPVDAVVAGITLVEDDPNDSSVGYGGLPNEDGVVELDASVMDGPMHKAGAVGALRNIKNPAQVALKVMRETDHVMLVGEGALKFARAHGFQEQDLLTPKSREAWLKWKRNLNPDDDWLNDDQMIQNQGGRVSGKSSQLRSADAVPSTWGTIHCAAVNEAGDIGASTSTSGLSWKLSGRVGDSPIIGAGMYVVNEVGAAGATGRGESVMQSCGAFQVVQHMANGIEPSQACLNVLKWIADHTKRKALLDERARPNFDVTMYALRKDGVYGSATMRTAPGEEPRRFAVHDGVTGRLEACAVLFAD